MMYTKNCFNLFYQLYLFYVTVYYIQIDYKSWYIFIYKKIRKMDVHTHNIMHNVYIFIYRMREKIYKR